MNTVKKKQREKKYKKKLKQEEYDPFRKTKTEILISEGKKSKKNCFFVCLSVGVCVCVQAHCSEFIYFIFISIEIHSYSLCSNIIRFPCFYSVFGVFFFDFFI